MSALPAHATTERLDIGVTATTRRVYRTESGTVIKTPKKDLHLELNEQEVEHWEEFQDPTIFAPIVDYAPDYQWIEMAECWTIGQTRENRLLDAFEEKMSKRGFDIIDMHQGNIGILPANREIVCVDYPNIE